MQFYCTSWSSLCLRIGILRTDLGGAFIAHSQIVGTEFSK